ncbi:MAG: nucleoside phosphorylase [Nocardioides sp.]
MALPILEFDGGAGFISPTPPASVDRLTSTAVLCFFPDVLRAWARDGLLREVGAFSEEVGGRRIYVHDEIEPAVTVFHPGMGGPLASHCLEQGIAAGIRAVIAVGGAGSLVPDFMQDDVLVVQAAIRDEGTSYHYLAPSREVTLNPSITERAAAALTESGIPHRVGKTWTTDADFRETAQRIAARRAEGCITVEMEAASLAAVCSFRDVEYGQLLYSGDALHEDTWQGRDWSTSGRRSQLLEVAVRLAASLSGS